MTEPGDIEEAAARPFVWTCDRPMVCSNSIESYRYRVTMFLGPVLRCTPIFEVEQVAQFRTDRKDGHD